MKLPLRVLHEGSYRNTLQNSSKVFPLQCPLEVLCKVPLSVLPWGAHKGSSSRVHFVKFHLGMHSWEALVMLCEAQRRFAKVHSWALSRVPL